METGDGERRWSDGQDCPALLKFQGLVGKILVGCIVFSLAYTLVTHASQHNPDSSHKTVQIQGTTCRWAGGALVEKWETFNAQRSTPNTQCLGAGGEGHVPSDLWLAAAGMRPRPDCTRQGAACPHYRQPGGRCGLSRGLCRAPAERTGQVPSLEKLAVLAEGLRLFREYRDFFYPEPGLMTAAPAGEWIHIGRLHYEVGCQQLYVGGEYFNLENHDRVRHLMVFMTRKKAFNQDAARHFRDEIDVYVRSVTAFPRAANIRIDDYFKDATGRLACLKNLLIKSNGRSGKYFLKVF